MDGEPNNKGKNDAATTSERIISCLSVCYYGATQKRRQLNERKIAVAKLAVKKKYRRRTLLAKATVRSMISRWRSMISEWWGMTNLEWIHTTRCNATEMSSNWTICRRLMRYDYECRAEAKLSLAAECAVDLFCYCSVRCQCCAHAFSASTGEKERNKWSHEQQRKYKLF